MEDPQEKDIDVNSTSEKVVDDNPGNSDESDGAKVVEDSQERLETKLSEAYGKQDDLQNKYLRVHADLENIKKRAIREREDAVQRTRSQLIGDLLPIIDSFRMGLSEASKHEEARNYVEGFAMATNQLENILSEYGLSLIEPTNQAFDAKLHEAISYEESKDMEDGIVIKTIRNGYKLGEKLLRPASVVLSKKVKAEN
ncbi:MAG: nucleotide exchange factor GrpE [Opitutales bacterium]|nr:nucleotide exchange factor GrpE [Opitutales bacterium]